MRIAHFERTILLLADGLEASGSSRHGQFLRDVISITRDSHVVTDTQLFAELAKIRPNSPIFAGARLSSFVSEMDGWLPFFESVFKAAPLKSVKSLLSQLRPLGGMSLTSFLQELRASITKPANDESGVERLSTIDDFVAALQESKHDPEAFPHVYERLKKGLNKNDTVEVASRFAFKMAQSTTTKAKALERIWDIHAASRSMSRKIESQDGKSAA